MCPPKVARNRRLFEPADEDFVTRSATNVDGIVRICSQWKDGVGMPQGYTYLGQFLAHEITSREPPRIPATQRTRFLDLDSVYDPPARFDQHGRFLYCPATALHTKDLLRDPVTKAAYIPDFRNDEHPIISQLHLMIQLFHNATLTSIRASSEGRSFDAERQFAFAKRYVIATVQRVYVEDYLKTCSDAAIYNKLIANDVKVFDIPPSEDQLPFEITHAALRFGHSQVRGEYLLNRSETMTPLHDLFCLSGQFSGPDFEGIPTDKRVDWRRFFRWGRGRSGIAHVSGNRINPKVVEAMSQLREPPMPDIVKRNLQAGIRERVPSGQVVAAWLAAQGIDERISPELLFQVRDAKRKTELHQLGMLDTTPLWLFVLIEASSHGGDGMCLGPVGSVFLCETIRSSLQGQEPYAAVQAACKEKFGLTEIATFEQLVKFAEPDTYHNPFPFFRSVKSSFSNLFRRSYV